MPKTRRIKRSKTRRKLRGGNNSNSNNNNSNSNNNSNNSNNSNRPQYNESAFKFNYDLFNRMKPDFLGSMPFDEKFMKYLNTSAILADVEMYLKKFLEDPDVIDSLLSMDDISNNMDDELYEFIMFDTSDEVQSIIDILSLNLGTDYVMERELSDMHSDIKSLVVDYIRSLPEANRKTLQNAINTHKVMSERVPANVAAQIAAYRTGVAPRNNPAYMK